VLAWRPALLLLDEPLNGLDAAHRARVMAALGTLSRSKLPWVYASHRPEEVPAAVTHWARLERGRLRIGTWRRRTLPRAHSAEPRVVKAVRRPVHPTLIELRTASVWRSGRPVLHRLTLRIRRGECWVVHGANGSGKSSFLATLFGEHGVASDGSLWRRFQAPGMPLSEFQDRVGWVAPELQATLPRQLTALECVVAGLRGAYNLDGAVGASERRAALRTLSQVGARRYAGYRFGELSYGQGRRVLFARALVRHPDIVLLDEPYTGLDALTRRRLRALIDNLVGAGRTIVMATHHRDDWPRGTGCELELAAGRPRYCGPVRRGPTVRQEDLP